MRSTHAELDAVERAFGLRLTDAGPTLGRCAVQRDPPDLTIVARDEHIAVLLAPSALGEQRFLFFFEEGDRALIMQNAGLGVRIP
jgi:hypothetical protein